MKSKGIRILDPQESDDASIELPDILEEIHNGNALHWSILQIDALGKFQDLEISNKGYFITWVDLYTLAQKSDQIIWLTLIGCKDEKHLRFYENDQEMYETCDIVIELIDSSYWELFAKDKHLISRLALKFKNTTFLKPNPEV